MVKHNGARGTVTILGWVLVVASAALFAGFIFTVFFK